jgi:Ca2+-binding RTX toxin-like protein
VPNIQNDDVVYLNPLTNPLSFRGLGAEHNSALIWANLQGLITDDLFQFYNGQKLIAGVTDYEKVPDYDGTPIKLFKGYDGLGDASDDNDRGTSALIGTAGADYIFAMSGNDVLEGGGGHDLLSGGDGTDVIRGGPGRDIISGGLRGDRLTGNGGSDQFYYDDVLQSTLDEPDIITDFKTGIDKLAFSGIDARSSSGGHQAFQFIGENAFSAEGQIRALQRAEGTTLLLNILGRAGAEMKIFLKGVDAASLSDTDFIL